MSILSARKEDKQMLVVILMDILALELASLIKVHKKIVIKGGRG